MSIRQSPRRSAVRPAWCIGLILAAGLNRPATAQINPVVSANIEQSPTVGKRPTINGSTISSVPEGFAKLRLQPGFLLQMDIFDVPEMDTALRVDENGDITVPFAGSIHVAGQTTAEAQARIAQALVAQEILKAPQVTLNVVQYSQENINVLGEVQAPGRINVLGPKSLADLLASVGGETQAAGSIIEVRHSSGETTEVHYVQGGSTEPLETALVRPGDSVFVRKAGIIYVLGAVNRPGGYLMVNEGTLNLLQAISLAYGNTLTASTGSVRIIRPDAGGGYKDINVPFHDMEHGKAQPFPLERGDIVFVPTSLYKSILIDGSALLTTAVSAAIYRVN